MVYKTGKLKGELTSGELRKLVRAHNKLYDIKIPKGFTQPQIVKLIKDNGYSVNHKAEKLFLTMKTLPKTIGKKDIPVPKTKTDEEKMVMKKKKDEKLTKQKQEKEIEKKIAKKEGVKEFKEGLKKAQKSKPTPPKPTPPKPTPPTKTATIGTQTQKKEKDKVKPDKMKFKLPSQTPDPVSIDKDKKPPKVDKSYKIVPVKNNYPLNVDKYTDIKNIPAGDVFKNLVEKRSNIFYPWTSISVVADIMFYHILQDNNSTCALPLGVRQKDTCKYLGKKQAVSKRGSKDVKKIDADGKPLMKNAWECKPVDLLKENAEVIAKRFVKCSQRNQALPIGISINGSSDKTGTHANLLLLNPLRMEAEHFEPHGSSYRGEWVGARRKKDINSVSGYKDVPGGYFKPPQVNLNPGVSAINKELKKIWDNDTDDIKKRFSKVPKLKYLKTDETCPSPSVQGSMNGFQGGDSGGRSTAPILFEGSLITEVHGYCQMWSLFYLDLRLKTLKKSSAEVFTEMISLLTEDKKKSGSRYIELMRGLSKYAWEQIQKAMTPKYNTHGATKEDFINFMGVGKKAPPEKRLNYWKVRDAITSLRLDLAKTITGDE